MKEQKEVWKVKDEEKHEMANLLQDGDEWGPQCQPKIKGINIWHSIVFSYYIVDFIDVVQE